MTENNRRQAFIPDDAVIITNPVGTAPCFAVEHGDQVVISLPGVPREMKFLLTEKVVPYLRDRYEISGRIIKAKVLKAAGIGESALDELIGTKLLEASNPTVGLAAHSGQIDVRITAKADSTGEADALIATVEDDLRQRIEPYLFGVDTDSIEGALIAMLREQGAALVVGEIGIAPILSEPIRAAFGDDVLRAVETLPSPERLAEVVGAFRCAAAAPACRTCRPNICRTVWYRRRAGGRQPRRRARRSRRYRRGQRGRSIREGQPTLARLRVWRWNRYGASMDRDVGDGDGVADAEARRRRTRDSNWWTCCSTRG